jgi:hypothetical protein
MGEIRPILKKTKILFAFKGYTCRFKSEAFASFASIALRPWILNITYFSFDSDIQHGFYDQFFLMLKFQNLI